MYNKKKALNVFCSIIKKRYDKLTEKFRLISKSSFFKTRKMRDLYHLWLDNFHYNNLLNCSLILEIIVDISALIRSRISRLIT